MRTRYLIVGTLFIAVLLIAVILARRAGQKARPAADPQPTSKARTTAGAAAAHTPRRDSPAPAAATRGGQLPKSSEARARLQRDIEHARERRVARKRAESESSSADTPTPELAAGALDKEYIQDRVRDIIPLIKECYELARDKTPDLEGTLVVRFSLAGEPEIGGVVESSEIDADKSTVADPLLSECLSESMYALEFEPPSNGGRVEVNYPFTFRTSAPE